MKQNIHLNAKKKGDVKLVKERQNAALNFQPRFSFLCRSETGKGWVSRKHDLRFLHKQILKFNHFSGHSFINKILIVVEA